MRVPKGTTLRLTANAIDANPTVRESTPIPICVFPDLSRDRFAGTWDFAAIPVQPSPRPDER